MELSSDEARKRGNEAFGRYSFSEALQWYHQAVELDPRDYRVPWNISAVQFEMGNYTGAAKSTEDTLDLTSDEIMRQKVWIRKVKAHLHLREATEARAVVANLPESEEKQQLQKAIIAIQETTTEVDAAFSNSSHVRHLPYYKPQAELVREYYTVGHDTAKSMLDRYLIDNSHETETLAFLFGGIGDARHMLQTCLSITSIDDKSPSTRCYHFTINDVKSEVFARDLLFFVLLDQLAKALPSRNTEPISLSESASLALATLYYTFIGQVMPPEIYDHLQSVIQFTLNALENTTSLPNWIRIDAKDIHSIKSALQSWQTEVPNMYAPKDYIQNLIRTQMRSKAQASMYGVDDEALAEHIPPDLRAEHSLWENSAYLAPPDAFVHPELRSILDFSDSKKRATKLRQYIKSTWKINPTLVDVGFVRQDEDLLNIGHTPFNLKHQLCEDNFLSVPTKADKLFDYAQSFFTAAARAIEQIGEHLVVEVVSGDITSILEDIKHSLLTERDPTFPTEYDRIHLSNTPDYIGGSLFNYVYALPLLKDKPSSFACSICLRNPPQFPTLASFDNEYTVLPDATAVEKVFKAHAKKVDDIEGKPLSELPLDRSGGDGLNLSNYYAFQPHGRDAGIEKLWSRARIEKWLYQLFMKIVLPTNRPTQHFELIYSPLNMTAFFRVLETVYLNGYPAHWLTEILLTLLTNRVKTTARPPRSYPLNISETQKDFAEAWVDLSPFMVELRTLSALWLPELPFGVASHAPVPSPSNIHRYTMSFTDTQWRGDTKTPVFTLLFCKGDQAETLFKLNIRTSLLSDEKRDKSPEATSLRKNSAVISTWEWDPNTNAGTFRLDEAVAERWKEDRWFGTIVRTDIWSMCALPVFCVEGLKEAEA